MLKKRIRKWNLDRNHKQADMLYAVKIALERESQGKKTAFLIRGRVVTFEEVQHYFRRKGVRDLRSLVHDAAVPTTRIECHTPKPSSILAEGENSNLSDNCIVTAPSGNRVRHSSAGVTVIPVPSQVAGVLQQSPELSQLHQLLHYGRHYYNSLFEARDWKNQQKSFELSSLETFYHKLSDGHTMLDAGYITVAFQHFDSAFDLIKWILDEGALLFLPYLYHMFLPVKEFQQQEVLLKMLAFVTQMIHVRFPHLRLIKNSLVLLHGMSIKQRGNCSVRVFQSLLDQLKAVFHDDVPNELQLREAAKQLCLPVHDNPGRDANGSDGYKLTSLAVWKLAKDANLVEASTPNQLVTRDQYAVEEITYSHFRNNGFHHHFISNGEDCSC
jgi:hypothetical protein